MSRLDFSATEKWGCQNLVDATSAQQSSAILPTAARVLVEGPAIAVLLAGLRSKVRRFMVQRSDNHHGNGGKGHERSAQGVTADVQSETYRPRSTIVPGALDEPFTEAERLGGLASELGASRLDDLALRDDLDDDESDSGPPTQPRLSVAPSYIPPAATSESQSAYELVPVRNHAKEKFYLRLELRRDCLADLWVRDLTPHNVLAWSDGMESWVPLLAVPELRDAIRSAQDKKTRDLLTNSQPPPATSVPSSENRIPLPPPRRAGSIVSAAPARAGKFWRMPHPRQMVASPPPVPVPSTIPAPPLAAHSSMPPRRDSVVPAVLAVRPQVARVSTPPQAAPPRSMPSLVLPSQNSRPSSPPLALGSLQVTRSSTIPFASSGSAADAIPSIPRPARVPAFDAHVAATTKTKQSAAKASGTLSPPSMSVVPAAGWAAKSGSLVNWERALWLAAGVSVATAASFILREPAETRAIASAVPVDGVVQSQATPSPLPQPTAPRKAASGAATHLEPLRDVARDAAKVEDLPLVDARGIARAPGKTAAHATPSGPAGPAQVQPENLTLASQPTHAQPAQRLAAPATQSQPVAAPSDGAFEPGQARRVLASASSRARSCADGPFSGAVQVTFSPSGFVQAASLLNLTGEGVRSGCVLRAFQEARVSPFVGAPVAVKKSFSFP